MRQLTLRDLIAVSLKKSFSREKQSIHDGKQRWLPTPVGAEDGYAFSPANLEVDRLQRGPFLNVGKLDLLQVKNEVGIR